MVGYGVNNPLVDYTGCIHHDSNKKAEKYSRTEIEFFSPPGVYQNEKEAKKQIGQVH